MLLTQMPAHPDSPEPKRSIAFDQAIRTRMEELGLDEAGLADKYTRLLEIRPNERRSLIAKMLNGESEPRLKTVFNLLHPQVLNGELVIGWADSNRLKTVPNPEVLAQVIRERMSDVGFDPKESSAIYELTRQYCHLKSEGKPLNPSNHIKVIKQLIGKEPNSSLQTITTVVQALKGQVLLRWRKNIRQELPTVDAAYDLLENLPPKQSVVIEYQELGEEQEIQP